MDFEFPDHIADAMARMLHYENVESDEAFTKKNKKSSSKSKRKDFRADIAKIAAKGTNGRVDKTAAKVDNRGKENEAGQQTETERFTRRQAELVRTDTQGLLNQTHTRTIGDALLSNADKESINADLENDIIKWVENQKDTETTLMYSELLPGETEKGRIASILTIRGGIDYAREYINGGMDGTDATLRERATKVLKMDVRTWRIQKQTSTNNPAVGGRGNGELNNNNKDTTQSRSDNQGGFSNAQDVRSMTNDNDVDQSSTARRV